MYQKPLLLVLFLLFGAAWISQSYVYIPLSEDYLLSMHYHDSLWGWISSLYQKTGIRRSFAMITNTPICAAPTWSTNYILLLIHGLATWLVFDVSKKLSESSFVGVVSAVVFGVLPWGYGAVTYACGSYTIPVTILFLAGVSVLLKGASRPGGPLFREILVSSVLLFAGCVAGEHLVFASAFVGLLALANTKRGLELRQCFQPWVLAPSFVAIMYIALVWLTQSGEVLMDANWQEASLSTGFNIKTLFAVWVYQFLNLRFFEPLFSYEAARIALVDMGIVRVFLGGAMLMGAVSVLLIVARRGVAMKAVPAKPWFRSPIPIVVVMMLSLSFVHALAGGYSASSRHQYVPLALDTMLFAAVAARFAGIDRLIMCYRAIPVAVACIVAVVSTWVVVAINRYELRTYASLCDYVAELSPSEPVAITLEPNRYHLWPAMAKTTSTDFTSEYSVNLNLRANGKPPISVEEGAALSIRVVRKGLSQMVLVNAGN